MKGYGGQSRRTLFERFDRPALQPLPARSLRLRRVEQGARQHRLPRRGRAALLLGAAPARFTATSRSASPRRRSRSSTAAQRVWLHLRSHQRGGTRRSPSTCRRRTGRIWSGRPSRLIRWAGTIGPATPRRSPGDPREPAASRARLSLLPGHPAAGEAARARAARGRLRPGARRRRALLRHVDSILKHGLDRLPLDDEPAPPPRAARRTRTSAAPAYYQASLAGGRPC